MLSRVWKENWLNWKSATCLSADEWVTVKSNNGISRMIRMCLQTRGRPKDVTSRHRACLQHLRLDPLIPTHIKIQTAPSTQPEGIWIQLECKTKGACMQAPQLRTLASITAKDKVMPWCARENQEHSFWRPPGTKVGPSLPTTKKQEMGIAETSGEKRMTGNLRISLADYSVQNSEGLIDRSSTHAWKPTEWKLCRSWVIWTWVITKGSMGHKSLCDRVVLAGRKSCEHTEYRWRIWFLAQFSSEPKTTLRKKIFFESGSSNHQALGSESQLEPG